LYTLFGYNKTHQSKQYVDYLQLKWGTNESTGSEHTIGGVRYAGEVDNSCFYSSMRENFLEIIQVFVLITLLK